MEEQSYLTAEDLIKALSSVNPKAKVLINIKQHNKVFGVKQLPIETAPTSYGTQTWVDGSYQGATITVFLPEGDYVVSKKKKK